MRKLSPTATPAIASGFTGTGELVCTSVGRGHRTAAQEFGHEDDKVLPLKFAPGEVLDS